MIFDLLLIIAVVCVISTLSFDLKSGILDYEWDTVIEKGIALLSFIFIFFNLW